MKIKVAKLPSVRAFSKPYEPIEVQERLLRIRAHVNAEAGNALLSKWMSENADRLTKIREANEISFAQFEINRSEPKSSVINENDPFDIPQYDVQGDALYDDEPAYVKEPFVLPKYSIDEDMTDNPEFYKRYYKFADNNFISVQEFPLWDFVAKSSPEELSSITNPALYEMMRTYKD